MSDGENELQVGDKVGVIYDYREETLYLVGYGKYVGDEVPPAEATGQMSEFAKALKTPVPKIQLKNGDIVYGCECWWGPKESVMEVARQAKKVVKMTVADTRSL